MIHDSCGANDQTQAEQEELKRRQLPPALQASAAGGAAGSAPKKGAAGAPGPLLPPQPVASKWWVFSFPTTCMMGLSRSLIKKDQTSLNLLSQ